jgi:hypothetical protein
MLIPQGILSAGAAIKVAIQYLIIAGGGGGAGGASRAAGGGGAGGYRSSVTGENSGRLSSAETPLELAVNKTYLLVLVALVVLPHPLLTLLAELLALTLYLLQSQASAVAVVALWTELVVLQHFLLVKLVELVVVVRVLAMMALEATRDWEQLFKVSMVVMVGVALQQQVIKLVVVVVVLALSA